MIGGSNDTRCCCRPCEIGGGTLQIVSVLVLTALQVLTGPLQDYNNQ